jgi:hypothetical protein
MPKTSNVYLKVSNQTKRRGGRRKIAIHESMARERFKGGMKRPN